MHVSRKADYAVRAMSYLATHPDRRVLISEVAREMAIPRAFLSKILKELADGALVDSRVGPGGGYVLARSAREITFREILEVVEGPWSLVPCQGDSGEQSCQLHTECTQVSVWDEIRAQMLEILAGYTLEEVKSRGLTAPGQVAQQLVSLSGAAG